MFSKKKAALALIAITFGVTGCSDPEALTSVQTPVSATVSSKTAQDSTMPFSGHTASRAVTKAAVLKMTAAGEFRPGTSIQVTTEVIGRHEVLSSQGQFRAEGGRVEGKSSDRAVVWASPVVVGSNRRSDVLVYDKPGYYALTADVMVKPVKAMVGDSVLLTSAHSNLWVLIDSTGGRVDTEYDAKIVEGAIRSGQRLRHGTVGEFVATPDIQQASTPSASIPNSARLMVDPVMSLNLSWIPHDSVSQVRRGLEYGNFNGSCKNGSSVVLVVQRYTDPNGNFNIICPAGSTTLQGNLTLQSATIRMMNGAHTGSISGGTATHYAAAISTPITIPANTLDSMYVASDETAKIYKHFQQWAYPNAYFEFGRMRGSIDYAYDPSGVETTAFFDVNASGQNIIRMITSNVVWMGYGDFTIVHEFGHAYHWTSIDHWASTYTCGGTHSYSAANTSSCAYVEGFADFFSAWLQRTNPAQDFILPSYVESSPNRYSGQGLLWESVLASMFWDLVDSPSGDDDAVAMGGSAVADVMRQCYVHSPNSALLTHSDQIIYCMEGVVNSAKFAAPTSPVNYQTSDWGTYGAALTWDFGSPPTLPNLTDFRALWKYNLYGI